MRQPMHRAGWVALYTLLLTLLPLQATLSAEPLETADGEAPLVVGFAQDSMSNDWRAAQVAEMAAVLAAHPSIRFIYTDAKGKSARQAQDLLQLDRQGADILVTSPRDHRLLTPVVESLAKRKPVILLTRKVQTDQFTSFIGADDHQIAVAAAQLIADRLGGKGRVVMLMGIPTATTTIARDKGFREGLANYPGISIVAAPTANYRRHEAITAMEGIIQQGIGFDAIYAHNDGMASGARLAMERAGLEPGDHVIVGIDYIPEAREAIRSGKQTASFTYPTGGREGAEVILRLSRGEKIDKFHSVPFTLVTRENVDHVATVFQ